MRAISNAVAGTPAIAINEKSSMGITLSQRSYMIAFPAVALRSPATIIPSL